ncbi:hypothetical protein F8S13_12875 [Chloroflexia bacterium SDU3-3]|nr:hypothetical protein F8S13_12875 [Chloroflexia bacterium SDU3-3]
MGFKKTFFMLVALMCALAPFQGAYAEGGEGSYQEVIDSYGMQVVQAAPPGITPLRVHSPAQLAALAKGLARGARGSHTRYAEPATRKPGGTVAATSYGLVTRSCAANAGAATFSTTADINVGYSGSFRWIEAVTNLRTGLSGFTLGLSMTDAYSYSYNQTASAVSVAGGANVHAYILLDTGATTVYTTPVSCSFTYSLY